MSIISQNQNVVCQNLSAFAGMGLTAVVTHRSHLPERRRVDYRRSRLVEDKPVDSKQSPRSPLCQSSSPTACGSRRMCWQGSSLQPAMPPAPARAALWAALILNGSPRS